MAATNCLNFGNPEKPEVMWQFTEAIDGIAEACRALEMPITGGNVSFYNETLGKPIYPTPVLGVLGLIEDAECALGSAFRNEGDVIVLLDARRVRKLRARRCSADVFFFGVCEDDSWDRGGRAAGDRSCGGEAADRMPGEAGERAGDFSAHDVSDGGMAVTIAECCFASEGTFGGRVDLGAAGEPAESALFGERGARAVVSLSRRDRLPASTRIAAQWKVKAQAHRQRSRAANSASNIRGLP